MAWDADRNTLYAATECRYIDRLGRNYDYRPAKLPKDQLDQYRGDMGEAIEGEDEDEDESEDNQEDWHDRAWPKNAFHGESYWGYTFDAARHTICKLKC